MSLTSVTNTALVYSTSPVWGMLLGSLSSLERRACGASSGWRWWSLSFLERVSPLAVAIYPMLIGGLAIFPFSLFDLSVDTGSLSGVVWFAALYSTVCSSAFGFAAWQEGVSRVGANRMLVYQYLVTLTGVSAGVIIPGESFGYEKVLGAVILLVGIYLARRG